MATPDNRAATLTEGRTSGGSAKMGLGVVLAVLTGVIGLGALVLSWFGVFPALALLLVCVPMGIVAAKWIRKGKPPGTPS